LRGAARREGKAGAGRRRRDAAAGCRHDRGGGGKGRGRAHLEEARRRALHRCGVRQAQAARRQERGQGRVGRAAHEPRTPLSPLPERALPRKGGLPKKGEACPKSWGGTGTSPSIRTRKATLVTDESALYSGVG